MYYSTVDQSSETLALVLEFYIYIYIYIYYRINKCKEFLFLKGICIHDQTQYCEILLQFKIYFYFNTKIIRL